MYLRKAKSRTARRELDAALKKIEPRVARAFLEAARSIRSRATLKSMAEAIQRGDVVEAVRLSGAAQLAERLRGIGLEPGATSFERRLLDALERGAEAGMRQLPRDASLRASLDLTNPEAVRYLRETIPTLIREVGEETQRAVRDAVLRGMTEGRPAPMIAREIRDSIGLTQKQAQAVGNLRRQLQTGELGNGKAPWTRRLSATERASARSIFNATSQGQSVDPARIDQLVGRYYESLVNRRSKDIARTEVHRAFTEGQQTLWQQAEERGLIDRSETRRVWIVTPDDRLRPDHAAIPDMNPGGVGLDEQFATPFGPVMGPSDPHPNLINCRCTVALEFDEDLETSNQPAREVPTQPTESDVPRAASVFGIDEQLDTVMGPGTRLSAIQRNGREIRESSSSAAADLKIKGFDPGKLSDMELIALKGYTKDAYKPINRTLRARKPAVGSPEFAAAEEISAGLKKLPKRQGDVYRMMEIKNPSKTFAPGTVFRDNGFASSSWDRKLVEGIPPGIKIKNHDNLIFMKIKSKNGRVVAPLSDRFYEREVLFDRGTGFKVVSVEPRPGGGWNVEVEEV